MTPEHPTSDNGRKPAKRQKQRNALYCLVTEFKARNPTATAAAAWSHFCAVAGIGCNEIVLRHDTARDALEYLPNPDWRKTKTVTWRAFARQYYRIRI